MLLTIITKFAKRLMFFVSLCSICALTAFYIPKQILAQDVQYVYDSLNRLAEVRYSDRIIRYTYDAAGNRTNQTIENLVAAPAITSLNPSSADAGTSGFTLVVSGANFTNNSIVQWNGVSYTTTYIGANEVRANIPASEINSAGTASVVVVNSSPDSVSNARSFPINLAPSAAIGVGGRVANADGAGLSDVAVVLTGANTFNQTTDENGEFNFTGLRAGVYTLTPSKANYVFSPASRTVVYLGGDSQGNDFIAAAVQQARRTPFDFDGDGKADFVVFRPSNGTWFLRNSLAGEQSKQFGRANDRLAPADYDGDGKTDFAFYRKRVWTYLQSSDGAFKTRLLGWKGDVPQPCDYDGDRRADFITFSGGIWRIRQSSDDATQRIEFGADGDIPAAADYDGDGKCELAVFNPNGGVFAIRETNGESRTIQFGASGDKIVSGDFDGDGKTDVAVFRPSNAVWHIAGSRFGNKEIQFGNSSDVPVPADYDGDGKTDLAVWRDGIFYVLLSTGNQPAMLRFGADGDVPTAATLNQ